MSYLAGKDFLLKVGDGGSPEVFAILGGLRTAQMSIDSEAVDVTNQGSNQWREILAGAGIHKMQISGTGVVMNDAMFQRARTQALANALTNFQIVDGVNTYQAAFKITKIERKGDYKSDQSYSISLESSGAVTIS